MDLRPLALALALIAPAANAACESWMASGSTLWDKECNGGQRAAQVQSSGSCETDSAYGAGCGGKYPAVPDHGTRTDVYVRDDGQLDVYKHQATGAGDNLRVYDYESGARVENGSSLQQHDAIEQYGIQK